jgi:hypothetical protein
MHFIKIGETVLDIECFSSIGYMYSKIEKEYHIICIYKNDMNRKPLIINCNSKKQAVINIKNIMEQINKRYENLLELKNMIDYAPGGEKYQNIKSHFDSLQNNIV